MIQRGFEPTFTPRIAQAIGKWDSDSPTTERSIRARHLLIFSVISELRELGVFDFELASRQQVESYIKSLGSRMKISGTLNKIRTARKLAHYLGIPPERNQYHLVLAKSGLKKPSSSGLPTPSRPGVNKDQKKPKNFNPVHLEKIYSGIKLLLKDYRTEIGPAVLHRELFSNEWDNSHTMLGCQILEKEGFLVSRWDTGKGLARKYYRLTGKIFRSTIRPFTFGTITDNNDGQIGPKSAEEKPLEPTAKKLLSVEPIPSPQFDDSTRACSGKEFGKYNECHPDGACTYKWHCEKLTARYLEDRKYEQGHVVVCLLEKSVGLLDATITRAQASRLIQDNIEIKESLKKIVSLWK